MPRNNSKNAAKRATKGRPASRSGVAQGDAKTIAFLNLILKNELTAINQYFLHSRMLADWGITEFSKYEFEESVDEMKHADSLVQRILFLGGLPNLQHLDKLMIGEDVSEIVECDLKLEEKAISDLTDAIAHAEAVKDYGSRELYTSIYESEEKHIDYLRTQQKLIKAIGIADYIQVQTQSNPPGVLSAPGE